MIPKLHECEACAVNAESGNEFWLVSVVTPVPLRNKDFMKKTKEPKNLIAMASNLRAMASNLRAMRTSLKFLRL